MYGGWLFHCRGGPRGRPAWARQRAGTPINDQPCRHDDPGAGQAQGLPLRGAIMRMIIWNKMPMRQPVQAVQNNPLNGHSNCYNGPPAAEHDGRWSARGCVPALQPGNDRITHHPLPSVSQKSLKIMEKIHGIAHTITVSKSHSCR